MIDKEQVLKLLGEPIGWRAWDDNLSRWDFTLFPEEDEGRDWEPIYTEAAAHAAIMAAYAKGAEDMRERAAQILDDGISATVAANEIRAIPVNMEGEHG